MPFEHPYTNMTGTISLQVLDPHGITPPAAIIQTGDPWEVQVDWEIDGAGAGPLGGDWHLEVFADPIGAGTGQSLGTHTEPLSSAPPPSPRKYTHTFNVSAGTLPVGTYRLIVLMTHTNQGVRQEIAAYDDTTIVQIYPYP